MAFEWNFMKKPGQQVNVPLIGANATANQPVLGSMAPLSATQQPVQAAPSVQVPFAPPAGTPMGENAGQVVREDLMAEYQRNNEKIAAIEAELKRIDLSPKAMDEMDRRLAVNRANAGDLAGSQYHQGQIYNRYVADQQKQAADNRLTQEKLQQNQKAVNDKIWEIQQIDQSLAHPENHWAREQLLLQRAQKMQELGDLGGTYPHAAPMNSMSEDEWDKFRIEHTDKNGVWDTQENKETYTSRPTKTAAEAEKNKEAGVKLTKEEKDRKKKAREARKAKADDLVKGLARSLNNESAITLKSELNEGKTDRAKLINEFYTFNDGVFKLK